MRRDAASWCPAAGDRVRRQQRRTDHDLLQTDQLQARHGGDCLAGETRLGQPGGHGWDRRGRAQAAVVPDLASRNRRLRRQAQAVLSADTARSLVDRRLAARQGDGDRPAANRQQPRTAAGQRRHRQWHVRAERRRHPRARLPPAVLTRSAGQKRGLRLAGRRRRGQVHQYDRRLHLCKGDGAVSGRRTNRSRFVTVALAGLLPASYLAVTGLTVSPAEAFAGTFSATAWADAVRYSFIVPSAPGSSTVTDVGGPSTQARLDALGDSRAFASFPYPGDLIVTLPGLFRGLSGIPLPGEYPFYVSA